MSRFYAPPEQIDLQTIRLDENETRHLRDVLRFREGDTVRVFDGEGKEFDTKIEKIAKRETTLAIISSISPAAPESTLDLTVCASILKGEKSDFAVQKAVELGVNRFVPMITARCDVKPKDSEKRVARWRKIVLEASKQCGRARLMSVGEVTDLHTAFESGRNAEFSILFTERDGSKFAADVTPASVAAYFGPEGGWDDSELVLARDAGAKLVTFNGRIMKADTAVLAISAILQHHFGDLN